MPSPTHEADIPIFRGKRWVGLFPQLVADPIATLVKASQLADVVQLDLPGPRILLITDPARVEHIYTHHNLYSKGTRDFDSLRKLTRSGLVGAQGATWLRKRRLVQPAFHRKSIQRFAEQMTRCTLEMLERWSSYLASGESFDLTKEISRTTLEIVGRTLIGGNLTGRFDEVFAAIADVLAKTAIRATSPLMLPDWLPTRFHRGFRRSLRVIDEVIVSVIEARRKSGERPGDMLDLLLDAKDEETGASMTDDEIRDEVLGMFIGGHETSSQTLVFAFYFLSRHPEVDEALRAEVARVLAGRLPDADTVPALQYTSAVLKEAMRIYPPGWATSRRVEEDDDCVGLPLKKGDLVLVSPYLMHHRASLWVNPEAYDPRRFLEAEGAPGSKRPKSAFCPFGLGPRKCIGDTFAMMEMQLIIATVAQRVRVEVASGYELQLASGLLIHPKNGLWVTARPA